ncbi:MAG TPA: hypothetical protein VFB23_05945 [Candidatus Acidoferrales bacterium]|nr:hypothetical protein [Candidatus Acidoferrales bacterium]
MAQWEADIGPRILALFALFFLIFLITRKRWARSVSVPTSLFVLNCAWLASATIYLGALKVLFFEGLPSAIAYFFIVIVSPVLAAAGALEGLVVVYHVSSIKTAWPTLALRRHCLAFLSAAFCFCVYLIARRVTAP